MFLLKLFRYNKFLFTGFVLFLIFFLFINFKGGMVMSPVNLFGMYSRPYTYLNDTMTTYRIIADGNEINLSRFSHVATDQLITPVSNFRKYRNGNIAVAEVMNHFFGKTGMPIQADSSLIYLDVSKAEFLAWYKNIVAKKLDRPVQVIEAYEQSYIWKDSLLPVSSPVKIF